MMIHLKELELIFSAWPELKDCWAMQEWTLVEGGKPHTALVSKAREEYEEWQNTLETEELIIILSSLS